MSCSCQLIQFFYFVLSLVKDGHKLTYRLNSYILFVRKSPSLCSVVLLVMRKEVRDLCENDPSHE